MNRLTEGMEVVRDGQGKIVKITRPNRAVRRARQDRSWKRTPVPTVGRRQSETDPSYRERVAIVAGIRSANVAARHDALARRAEAPQTRPVSRMELIKARAAARKAGAK